MHKKLITALALMTAPLMAEYTLVDGKLVEKGQVPTQSVQEHYQSILKAYENKRWSALEKEALIVIKNFPDTPYARDVAYFLAVAYYNMEEYALSNYQLTDYLTRQATPKYFEQAIQCKFDIAQKFQGGARKHLMGLKSLPKWISAGDEAIEIYDEVIAALPHHELAAQSLFGKGQIQAKREDFRAGVESYQTLIRRFPKHPLAVESYINIGKVYLDQSRSDYPDPDFLELAELNLKKFRTSFPGEEKISQAESYFVQMQDHYASSLFETAQFYERTKKLGAAKIYYEKILKTYPDANVAVLSKKRLKSVCQRLEKETAKKTA